MDTLRSKTNSPRQRPDTKGQNLITPWEASWTGHDCRLLIQKSSKATPPLYVPVTQINSAFQAALHASGTVEKECEQDRTCIFFPHEQLESRDPRMRSTRKSEKNGS
jgi:hypothetical protein